MELDRIKFMLSDLATDMTLYSQMFGPKESVDVLNKFNGLVFGRLQYCLIDRIFLGFAKFMDPAESGFRGRKNENLSLKYLIQKYKLSDDPDVKEKY